MGWETPKHRCGHDGERLQMYGPMKNRARRLEAMEREDCPECRVRAVQEEAEKEGLPLLTGSPKQIAWAGQIRKSWLRKAEDFRVEIENKPTTTQEEFKIKATILAEIDRLWLAARERTSSREWIDARDSSIQGEACRAAKQKLSPISL